VSLNDLSKTGCGLGAAGLIRFRSIDTAEPNLGAGNFIANPQRIAV
jgi:hypothetical protein